MLFLLVTSTFILISKVQPARADRTICVSGSERTSREIQTDAIDWWTTYGHDNYHTGHSTSIAPDNNETLWMYKTNGFVFGSPAIADGVVFIGSEDQNVYALDAATGRKIWAFDTHKYIETTPTVVNGRVFIGTAAGTRYTSSEVGALYALNASTGALLWFHQTDSWMRSSPTFADGKILASFNNGDFYAFNETTGVTIWAVPTGMEIASTAAVDGNKVFIGSSNNSTWDGVVYALDAMNGAYIWNFSTGGFIYQDSPTVVDGRVYIGCEAGLSVGAGRFYALDENTGTELWSYPIWVGSTPAVADGKVFIGGSSKLLALDALTGAYIWSYEMTGDDSSPAVADGKVFIGSLDGTVLALDEATGSELWSYRTGDTIASSPSVANGMLYIGSYDHYVYCFGNAPAGSYDVTFTESGLPSGYTWTVTLNGVANSTSGNVITFNEANGEYPFSIVSSSGLVASPTSQGTLKVDGDTDVAITWGALNFQTVIKEVGLPGSTAWSVTYQSITQTSTSDSIAFNFFQGNPSFSVNSVGYTAEQSPVFVPAGCITNVIFLPISSTYQFVSWDPIGDSYSLTNPGTIWSTGGNCYGFSSTALLYWMHYSMGDNTYPYYPSQTPQATSTSGLGFGSNPYSSLNNATLEIMFHQVYDPNAWGHGYPSTSNVNNTDEYLNLFRNLTGGQPVVLILGNATGWYHAVVSWGAGKLENGSDAIAVYDPNYPEVTQVAIYVPDAGSFSYVATPGPFDRFATVNPAMISTSWGNLTGVPWWQNFPVPYWWWHSWLNWSVPNYYVVMADKMVTVNSSDLKDYFTSQGNSSSFVCGIPGSSGIEEGNLQIYAIPEGTDFTVADPSSNASTVFIGRVDNESGQLVGYGYFLNTTTTQVSLNYTITPSISGLSVGTTNNALNANVTFFYVTQQNYSVSSASNMLGAMQTTNFTVTNWQTLNDTGIQTTTTTVPEFPHGALGIILTLSAVLFVALVTVVRRRKIKHPQGTRSTQEMPLNRTPAFKP